MQLSIKTSVILANLPQPVGLTNIDANRDLILVLFLDYVL
jgi:hypothetical protein